MSFVAPISHPIEGQRDRDAALDIARGLAMVLVVYGHALDGAQSAGHSTHALRFMMILVYTFHVPLFFQVSGILSRGLCQKPWPDFLSEIGTRVVWPYLLWAFILLTLHYAMGNHTNAPLESYQPLSILWRAPAVLWFLYVLCLALILLRLLAPLPWPATFTVGVICLLLPYLVPDWPPKSRFIGMFLIGAVGGPVLLRHALQPFCIGVAVLAMTATTFWAVGEAHNPIQGYPAFDAMFIPAMFAGPVLVYAVSHWLTLNGSNTLLCAIGRNTMAIFVTHILVTAGMRIALLRFGVVDWSLIILVASIAGVGLPLLAAHFARRAGLTKILGWQ